MNEYIRDGCIYSHDIEVGMRCAFYNEFFFRHKGASKPNCAWCPHYFQERRQGEQRKKDRRQKEVTP